MRRDTRSLERLCQLWVIAHKLETGALKSDMRDLVHSHKREVVNGLARHEFTFYVHRISRTEPSRRPTRKVTETKKASEWECEDTGDKFRVSAGEIDVYLTDEGWYSNERIEREIRLIAECYGSPPDTDSVTALYWDIKDSDHYQVIEIPILSFKSTIPICFLALTLLSCAAVMLLAKYAVVLREADLTDCTEAWFVTDPALTRSEQRSRVIIFAVAVFTPLVIMLYAWWLSFNHLNIVGLSLWCQLIILSLVAVASAFFSRRALEDICKIARTSKPESREESTNN